MAKVKYSGVAIDAGDTQLIVPALTFGQLSGEAAPLLAIASDEMKTTNERISAKLGVVHLALNRNYPGMTVDDVTDAIDLNHLSGAFTASLGVSAEAKTKGE